MFILANILPKGNKLAYLVNNQGKRHGGRFQKKILQGVDFFAFTRAPTVSKERRKTPEPKYPNFSAMDLNHDKITSITQFNTI